MHERNQWKKIRRRRREKYNWEDETGKRHELLRAECVSFSSYKLLSMRIMKIDSLTVPFFSVKGNIIELCYDVKCFNCDINSEEIGLDKVDTLLTLTAVSFGCFNMFSNF